MSLITETMFILKDNNLSFTEHFAQSQYQYPRHIYEGLEFFIDLTTIANENTWLLREFGINFHQIVKHYCPEESTYISPAPAEAETILKKLWELFDLPDPVAVTQMKIYSLALFSYLQNLDNLPPSQACTFFTETQVDIAKQVKKSSLPTCASTIQHGNWPPAFLSVKPA